MILHITHTNTHKRTQPAHMRTYTRTQRAHMHTYTRARKHTYTESENFSMTILSQNYHSNININLISTIIKMHILLRHK